MTDAPARDDPGLDGGGASRTDVAYQRLRLAILTRRFRPGDRMREAELAGWLGISRTPIRDALKRLEADGLLTAAPRRGLVVTELDQQQVSELYALRDVLEGLAAGLAASHASDAEVAALQGLIDQEERLAARDPAAVAEANVRFHDAVYRSARNRYLLTVLAALQGTLSLLPGTTYSAPGRPAAAIAEHRAILAAIVDRDSARASAAARAHIRAAERIRQQMLSGGTQQNEEARRHG